MTATGTKPPCAKGEQQAAEWVQRMFGEIAPILCAAGQFDAMRDLEKIAGEFTASRPVSILCGYSTDCLQDTAHDLLAMICGEHAAVVPADAI